MRKHDEDNPEVTDEQFTRARKVADVWPQSLLQSRSVIRRRGPQLAPKKVAISIRLDQATVAAFKATGPGWQGRMNDTLAAHAPTLRVVTLRAARSTPRSPRRRRKPAMA